MKDALYKNLDLAIDTDSRIALVGPNGVGKSTLLKLMTGQLDATEGRVGRNMSLKLSMYNQHTAELLPLVRFGVVDRAKNSGQAIVGIYA
jgi:ATP-binding cassette subfamily F protein 2